jgi:hypothetical protein
MNIISLSILIRYLIHNEIVQNNTVSMSHKQQYKQISYSYLKTTHTYKKKHPHLHTQKHTHREYQIIEDYRTHLGRLSQTCN